MFIFLHVTCSGLHIGLFRVGVSPSARSSEVVNILRVCGCRVQICPHLLRDGVLSWRGRARCWPQAAVRLGPGSAASSWRDILVQVDEFSEPRSLTEDSMAPSPQ